MDIPEMVADIFKLLDESYVSPSGYWHTGMREVVKFRCRNTIRENGWDYMYILLDSAGLKGLLREWRREGKDDAQTAIAEVILETLKEEYDRDHEEHGYPRSSKLWRD